MEGSPTPSDSLFCLGPGVTGALDPATRAKNAKTDKQYQNIRNECSFLEFGYKATMSKSEVPGAGLSEDKDSEDHILRENQTEIERYLLFPTPYHTCK